MTKTGVENPSTAIIITVRSIQVPCFHAATTPIGMARLSDRIRVSIISDSVGSIRCAIMCVTGRLVKIEVPRSPCRMCQNQSKKRTRNGRSSPSEARMRSTSAGVAWSPAMIAAGSPGAMYSRLNTNSATSSTTGMVETIRRAI